MLLPELRDILKKYDMEESGDPAVRSPGAAKRI